MLTVFCIRKFIEHRETVSLRPKSYQSLDKVPKLDKESMESMRLYLLDNTTLKRDDEGNNDLHRLIREQEPLEGVQEVATAHPQQLFMLNKHG